MKNVLLLVHDDKGQEARFQSALDLTRALGGHLTCVDVSVLPIPVAGDYYGGGAGTGLLLEVERDHEHANKTRVEERLREEGLPWTWIDITESLSSGVLAAADMSDIIVLNRKLDSSRAPNMRNVTSEVVMHARKPVVAVPDNARRFDLDRALIAWDGQACCAETVRACIPLLSLAKEVEIFMVRDGAEKIEPTEAAEYLSRHNIHAEVRIVTDGLTPADEIILDEMTRFRADYVIMGAYGHGRLLEAFGGVTKRLLATSPIPLVLGH